MTEYSRLGSSFESTVKGRPRPSPRRAADRRRGPQREPSSRTWGDDEVVVSPAGPLAPVTMEPVWAPFVAALGTSFLTGILVLARDYWRDHREERQRLSATRAAAYGQLMTISGLLVHTAGAMHSAMATRSGLREGLNTVFHITKPVDSFQRDELQRQ